MTTGVGKSYTEMEVEKHNTYRFAWVTYEGEVYDISQYLASGDHPGGNSVFNGYLGKDITKPFNDIVGHSEAAKNLLKTYHIGTLNPSKKVCDSQQYPAETRGLLNLNKALLPQIYNMDAKSYRMLSVFHMFQKKQDFKWCLVPGFWFLIAVYLFLKARQENTQLGMSISISLTLVGAALWYIAEYCVNTLILDNLKEELTSSKVLRVTNFLLHVIHHAFPENPLRLLTPPAFLIILSGTLYILLSPLLPVWFLRNGSSGKLLYNQFCVLPRYFGQLYFYGWLTSDELVCLIIQALFQASIWDAFATILSTAPLVLLQISLVKNSYEVSKVNFGVYFPEH